MPVDLVPTSCPLCLSEDTQLYHQDKKRPYLNCSTCQLVFVPKQYHLSPADEKAEYDMHDNCSADQGYRRFLSRTWQPLKKRLTHNMRGLDFGCGEGAVLSQMAKEDGYHMENYDLFYHPDQQVLQQQYHFITLTEVIEHIADSDKIWRQLDSLLAQQGILAVMTKRVLSLNDFAKWHYKNDPTHISYYCEFTFCYLATKFNWTFEIIDKDVVFFTKP
ncbi:type 12 methyltransferase [Catenovulum agarivorans DS-2]|uniref:Type 12 methyltransferase n=1 Tax=Catenovulum agarivorans DS-2 TaxID=1328313 RepID=W7Q7K9_9ALTE|nr:class I SAM-dependent methyltransferase [Catenovulum agarivorans]EWH08774.1 type 12 methyltransferase [Catenovulum agarivorans DS-2]